MDNLVRFDWAIKRILRNKADYCIVEGLLTVLLGKAIHIQSLLESEGNKDDADDKFNRVDILAEDDKHELMIFEIQNNRELDYFHRMAYGTSKVLCEYIKEGEEYAKIRKVYSVNIVYFSLGQGEDYAYHGTTQFVGMHKTDDILQLSIAQRRAFGSESPADIFPEYYLLRVDKFDSVATTPLEEWISFLKTGEIPVSYKAPGLTEARERLRIDTLSDEEKKDYHRRMENLRYQRSVIFTGRAEGLAEGLEKGHAAGLQEGLAESMKKGHAAGIQEGMEKGIEEKQIQIISNMRSKGYKDEMIADILDLSIDYVKNH